MQFHQNSNYIHQNIKKSTLKFIKAQKTSNSQGNTKQKRATPEVLPRTILQSHSNKNSMVPAQKQIRRPVEQNGRPRYQSMQLHLPDF
jgi:hypothetical protein